MGKALTPEQQRIQALEAQIRKIEREKNILKEARDDTVINVAFNAMVRKKRP